MISSETAALAEALERLDRRTGQGQKPREIYVQHALLLEDLLRGELHRVTPI